MRTLIRSMHIPFKLLITPLFWGIAMCIIWYVLFRRDISLLEADEPAFTDAVIPIAGLFHAIFAGNVIDKVWKEYLLVMRCIRRGDVEGFKDCMQERIPGGVTLLLFVLTILIQASMLLLHWENLFAGLFANFCVAFVLSLIWGVAIDLDNPRRAWYYQQIPDAWKEFIP